MKYYKQTNFILLRKVPNVLILKFHNNKGQVLESMYRVLHMSVAVSYSLVIIT